MMVRGGLPSSGPAKDEDDSAEIPPEKSKVPEESANTRTMTAKEFARWKVLKEENRRKEITGFASKMLKWCVLFLMGAYALEVVSSMLLFERATNSADKLLSLIQYIAAGLMGYLFGQSSAKE